MRLQQRALVLVTSVLVAFSMAGCKKDRPEADDTSAVTLQFRPVSDDPNPDCKPVPNNPPANQPIALLYQNQCIALSPARLVVRKADAAPGTNPNDARQVLDLRVRDADAARMAKLSRDYLNKQMAVVALGRILALPRFQAEITDGRVEITGVNRGDALRLKAALK